MSNCQCWRPTAEGHDYNCRKHPRRKRSRITDRHRLNAVIKWAKEAMSDQGSAGTLWAQYLLDRKSIDKAIKEERE